MEEGASQQSTIERKQKSYSTALLLGFSPIPSDGLFYTKHPVQGALSLLIGGLGLGILIDTLMDDCHTSDDKGDCLALRNAGRIVGATTYGAGYFWDAFGTSHYAKEYKKPSIFPKKNVTHC